MLARLLTSAVMDSCCRTVVVSGVPDVLPASRMTDKLIIHFQRYRRSHGGDVEGVRYPTNMAGVAFVTFDDSADAERVVRKEQQIMMDDEFPGDYALTVFPFSRDVFLYVHSAVLDLSVFGGDQSSLIQSLRSAHRSVRFQPVLEMKATIEGPFAAVQALRRDLIRRASRLKSTVSAQTAAVKLRETPLNPRVISHHKSVGAVSRAGSKAKPGPACTNCLSTPLQTTGEATEVQTLLSKTQNVSTRQKVSSESLAVGSFRDKKEQQSDRDRLERTEKEKADPRQGLNAEVKSSLSGADLLKQPGVGDISEKLTRTPTAKIRGETHVKESDQSRSAVTAKILQTRLKDVSSSSRSATEDLSAICPQDQEDTCIWVDSYTFRYIDKFDKKEFDRRLNGLEASVKCVEGTELTQISLNARRNSRTDLDSRIRWALEDLKGLVKVWELMLRVQQIDFDNEDKKQNLIKICNDVSLLYNDVLYVFEDSCVKIIGSSVFSHLFRKRVEEKVAELKDTVNVMGK